MDAIDLFASLLAQCGRVRSVEYSSFSAYHDLIKTGLIEETGVVSSVICDECDHPHDAKIAFEDQQYGYYCPQIGFVSKPRSELVAVQPNLSTFVSKVADALNCKRRKSSPLDKDTWRIGAVDSPVGDVVLYLHPNLRDTQDRRDLQAALISEIKSAFGVVLTSNGTLTVSSFATAQLRDVLSFETKTGKFIVIVDLRTIAGVPVQRTGGRPNDYRKPLSELIAFRASKGHALQGRNAEAEAVHGAFKAQFPNIKCPSLSTVKKYVSEVRGGS